MKNNEATPAGSTRSSTDTFPLALATNITEIWAYIGIASPLTNRVGVCPVYSLKDE
ncbi:hypothetical protein [Brumicola nitratireducens]|uniref:Uncharacterized protein n=1 Tax=Glaciecola nitratireducens (strain JCM 12485 / KCTC 12276 / FR1064) TaxID=1085623 RepID=G4QGP8_GLANF|nr:hypothetical protein [Glaciecola nitratireducens]AEP29685.1 hypothetical protein GNIT_1567 [Glaciecola nitratireducens FR1064]